MRATFPLLLAVSLAVHALIAASVALWFSFSATSTSVETDPTLSFIRPIPLPVWPTSAPVNAKPVTYHPIALSKPAAMRPPHAVRFAAVIQPASSVLAKTAAEPNPNAQLPPPSPDAALSPVPAPRLDGTKGVVFILDISGSMYEPYAGSMRLTFARQALCERVRALPDGTPFAIVLYAQRAFASGPLVAANQVTREAAVRFLMRDVNCDGGTNLPAGLTAARALNTGALVLATDGDLNISAKDLMLQSREILGEKGNGPSLLIIGISPRDGTPADHLLQDLANLEGGSYQLEQSPDETALLLPPKLDAAQ